MFIGRKEKDLKLNYGVSFVNDQRVFKGIKILSFWCFKLTPRYFKIEEKNPGNDISVGKKGFLLSIYFLNPFIWGKIIKFELL